MRSFVCLLARHFRALRTDGRVHNNTGARMQSSRRHPKSSPNIASLWRRTKNHSERRLISVWNSSANAHTCLALFHGCYSLIRFFVQLSHPRCLRLHQAPSKWLPDNRTHPSSLLSPFSVRACSFHK